MQNYNVFICYRGETCVSIGTEIFHDLIKFEANGIMPFFAPRCIGHGEDFMSICEDIAGKVSLMILLITPNFFENINNEEDVVGRELKSALSNKDCAFLPVLYQNVDIMSFDLSDCFTLEDIKRITHVNPIRFIDMYSFDPNMIINPILSHFSINSATDSSKKSKPKIRSRSHISDEKKADFFSDSNSTERRRLNEQQKLLLKYDTPVFDRMLAGKKNVKVLDLGTGNGTTIMDRLRGRPEIRKLIGVDFDSLNIEHANKSFANDNIAFYQCDIESDDFEDKMLDIMEENGIDGFDFICNLAILSHLKNPSKLFKTIRKFCAPDAFVLTRTVDDGLNVAFPDPDGMYQKALSILSKCISSGYRFSGREVFTYYHRWGYRNITFERNGINTTEMNATEREALYDVVFKFIEQGITREKKIDPQSEEISELYDWFMDKKQELEDEFMSSDFFFNFGFVIFTAQL